MTRRERQGTILRLVRERDISTQAELAEALHDQGCDVVQTTVSRDIAELGLRKVRSTSGRLVYAPPGAANGDRFREIVLALRRWALTFEASANLVIITTPSGYANALAQVMDEAGHPKIAGTIAGDNTVLAVAREGVTGAELRNELRQHLMEGAA
jgi:transcriptional regulator of arginine metabolism